MREKTITKNIKKPSHSATPAPRKQKIKSKLAKTPRVHNDLESVMDTANVGVLFLDHELCIRRYTPGLMKLINIRAEDCGRPVARLKRRSGYEQIAEDASQVLHSLLPLERQFGTDKGQWFVVRLSPDQSQENDAGGVVLTFIEVTAVKQAEQGQNETLQARVRERTAQRDEANWQLSQTRNTVYTLFHANPIPAALIRVEDEAFINVNDAFLNYFELKLEDVIGHTVQDLKLGLEPQSEERTRLIAQLQEEGGLRNFEAELILPSGKPVAILVSLQSLQIGHTEAILSVFVDITERKQAEQMLRNMVDAAPDATVVIDEAGMIVLVNKQLEKVFGYARGNLIGKSIETLIPERFHEVHPRHRMRYFREPRVRPMGSGLKLYGRRSDGTEFPVEISLSPLKTAESMLVIAAIRDVTERMEMQRKMQQLASLLSEAEQREQRRISQLLHDDLQQRLYAVKTELFMIDEKIKNRDWDGLQSVLADVDQSLAESISITRNLSIDLRPMIPKGKSLPDAFAVLSTQMQKQYSLDVALKTDNFKTNMDEGLQELLFQVVRELLFNVVKHAGTQRAAIAVERVDGEICITVSDEGKGFDPVAVLTDSGNAHGLFILRERLSTIGCQMEVTSMPGAGTRVVIHCPNLDS